MTVTFDLLTLKAVSESGVTLATHLVFLGLSVLDVGPMYATERRQTDRQQTSDVRQHNRLMPGGGIKIDGAYDRHELMMNEYHAKHR